MALWEILYDVPVLILAAAIVACSWLPPLRRRLPLIPRLSSEVRPDRAVRLTLGVSAAVLLLLSLARRGLNHLVGATFLAEYHWWAYADLLLSAGAALLCLAVVIAVRRRTPITPVAPSRPRTWRSFLGAGQIWLLILPTVMLLALVAFAGSISSHDSEGIHRILRLNTYQGGGGGMEISFLGWAYGLPVAGTTLALVLATLLALHLSAVRPFLRPESVPTEEASRSTLSTLFLFFSAGAVLVTLARATRLVATAGDIAVLSDGYQWETSVSAISPWLFWASLALQLVGYVLLLMVVRIALRRPSALPDAHSGAPSRAATGSRRGLNTHG